MKTSNRKRQVAYEEAAEFAAEYGLIYREIFADNP